MRFLKRYQELLYHKYLLNVLQPRRKLSLTTVFTMKLNHGKHGRFQSGKHPNALFSLNFSFQLVIPSVQNISCRESPIFQLKNTKKEKKTVLRILYLSVVLVPPRLQLQLCLLLSSIVKRCFSRELTSPVPLNQLTSRNLSNLKLNVNKLVFSSHQTENF